MLSCSSEMGSTNPSLGRATFGMVSLRKGAGTGRGFPSWDCLDLENRLFPPLSVGLGRTFQRIF
jgi:hypothetical protein